MAATPASAWRSVICAFCGSEDDALLATLLDFAEAFLLAVPHRIAQAIAAGFVDRLLRVGNCGLVRDGSSGDVAAAEHSAGAGARSAGNGSCANCCANSAACTAASSSATDSGATARTATSSSATDSGAAARTAAGSIATDSSAATRTAAGSNATDSGAATRTATGSNATDSALGRRQFPCQPSPHRQPLRHPVLRPCTRCQFPHRYLNLRLRPFLIRGPIQFLARRILGRQVRHESLPRRRSTESFSPGC